VRRRINDMSPASGRMLLESGRSVNVGETFRQISDAMDPLGGIRVANYQPIFSAEPLELSVPSDRVITTGEAAIELNGREYKLTKVSSAIRMVELR